MELTDIRPIVEFYHSKLAQVTLDFKRYLYPRINWDSRVIGIKGERGVGKTTMLLQRIKEKYSNPDDTFYISLDHYWFGTHQLQDLIEFLYKRGITEFYIDEVHKYKGWSTILKNLVDQYKDLRIVYTGSSLLEIDNAKVDMSRRQTSYTLKGMSFREYLAYEDIVHVDAISLEDLLKNHITISMDITAISKKVAAQEAKFTKDPESMSREELEKLIADIQKKMKKAAAELNFEAAAEYRDQMISLKKMLQEEDR